MNRILPLLLLSLSVADPRPAYTNLRTTNTITGRKVLGTRFTVSKKIRVTQVSVDGSASQAGLYADGQTSPIETWPMASGSAAVDRVLNPGTYRIAAAFTSYHSTPIRQLSIAPDITGIQGVYVTSSVLAYPTNTSSTTLYGNVNFKYALVEGNQPPVAKAGSDQSVGIGSVVILDGAESSDPDGDTLSYRWTQTSGPAVTLSSPTAATPRFTASATGTYVFQLVVNDGSVDSAPDEVSIAVTATPKLAIKLLVLNYDPIIESEGGKRLHQVLGWTDPRVLMDGYIADIEQASGGFIDYTIAEWKDVDDYPIKKDGFRYTDASFLQAWRVSHQFHQPDAVDYVAIVNQFGIAEAVDRGDYDEVILWGAPYFGWFESCMAGRNAYWVNGTTLNQVASTRSFIIMGFNYERGVGEALESFGHRVESILTHVYGGWDSAKGATDWDRFTRYDKIAPGKAGCGNVHFAPNSLKDYDWGNLTLVDSTCDDWLGFPALTGAKRKVNTTEWGGGDIRKHHVWWLTHLPKAAGASGGGKQNNWWKYAHDFNSYP